MDLLSLTLLFTALAIIFTDGVTSIRFLFSVLVLLTYVLPSLFLWEEFKRQGLVIDSYKSKFILLIALSYLGFLLGYQIAGSKKPVSILSLKQKTDIKINYKKLELYSIAVGLIGLAGYGFFILHSGIAMYLVGHNAGDFSVGGYIYELRFFIFSGVLLLFNIYLKQQLSKRGKLFLIFFTSFLVMDAYISAQRGSWIRLGVIYIISFLFHQQQGKKITISDLYKKYKIIFISGMLLGLLLVFTVQMRKYVEEGKPAMDVISLTANDILDNPLILIGGSGIGDGNEYVTAYNAFYANERVQVYDYGKKWLYGFVNFVPRNLWSDKPTLFTFSTDEFTLISNYSLISIPPGSVWTGIVDSYYRFAWFSPIFFVLFGNMFRRIYTKAYTDLNYRFFYISLYIGFFYFFTQEMFPLIIFTLYIYIPVFFATKASTKR